MIRYFLVSFLLVSISLAKEYPTIYTQLANPLYDSIKPLSKLSNIADLNKSCSSYTLHVENILAFGRGVDSSDKKAVKEYLSKLRNLQKEYEYTLHVINKNISISIDEDNYKKFLKLTDCDIDGLLKSRVLLDKAIKYYTKNRSKKKSKYFEEKISFTKLLKLYQEEIYNQSIADTFSSTTTTKKSKKVYLEAKEMKGYIAIYIYNNKPFSITMSIDAKYKELDYDRDRKKSIVLKSKSKLEYIRLYTKNRAYSYSISFRWIIGSVDAVHDDRYLYQFPYKKGTKYRVSQGFNGKVTHFGRSKYAVDFAMDIGTDICAARDGKIVRIKSNSNKNGIGRAFSKYANYINIEHDDGTIAMYYHLKKDGVAVKVGERVKRGQLIGYSGNTGYSSGPHLHFGVFKASTAKRTQTLAIKFTSLKGTVDNPKVGRYYEAK